MYQRAEILLEQDRLDLTPQERESERKKEERGRDEEEQGGWTAECLVSVLYASRDI